MWCFGAALIVSVVVVANTIYKTSVRLGVPFLSREAVFHSWPYLAGMAVICILVLLFTKDGPSNDA